ncbi:hypothetical protein [Persephonella sp.]
MSYLEENLKIANLHLDRLRKASTEILEKKLLENLDIDNFETIKVVDTFVYRFIKLQDYLGQKLFRNFLRAIGEDYENLSFIDILDKLEKLDIISSAEEWIEVRKLRNKLTLEYPDELEYIKEKIELALRKIDLFINTIRKISNYVKDRGLI